MALEHQAGARRTWRDAVEDGTLQPHQETTGPLGSAWGMGMRRDALADFVRRRRGGGAGGSGGTGRLDLPTIDDRERWQRLDSATVTALQQDAEARRGVLWPNALASSYARYQRDGNRTEYEGHVADRQQRLTGAVVMACLTNEVEWVDEAVDGAIVLCEQSTWSWAAHDDAHARRGFVVCDADSPTLDLGAGEAVAQLALLDHVLRPRLDARWPGVHERIQHEAWSRVFVPFLSQDDLWWFGHDGQINNWNPWIVGNVITAAAQLIDDVEQLAELLEKALACLDRFVSSLPEDGAVDEGFGYWWNGVCRLLECLETVSWITENALDATGIHRIREALRYPLRMQLGEGWYVNVADGRARLEPGQPWHVPFNWGMAIGDDDVVAHARAHRTPGLPLVDTRAGLGRVLRALTDAAWQAAAPCPAPLPRSVWLSSVQLLVSRQHGGSPRGVAVAVKGGNNGENHNHKDVGEFIVALDGQPVIIDLGKPTYTAQTFSAQRYGQPAMQSGWHNVPAPFGLEQGEGTEFAARLLGEPRFGTQDSLSFDLAGAYPLRSGTWRRSFDFDRASGVLTVTDQWSIDRPNGASAPTALHLMVVGDVSTSDAGVIVRPPGTGRALQIETEPVVIPALEDVGLDDPELAAVWGPRLTRLTYTAPVADQYRISTRIVEER